MRNFYHSHNNEKPKEVQNTELVDLTIEEVNAMAKNKVGRKNPTD